MRKMLVAMAKDVRVLLIKLADRLHNMRTIASLPEAKQKRIAQETLDIYAPLAHRLGVQDVKWQLEDLSFACLQSRYAEIDQMVASRAPEREIYLAQVLEAAKEQLGLAGIASEVTGRPKHLWSIYEKMVVRGKEFDEIYDLVGIRVIVDSAADCYAALGAIHSAWTPLPEPLQGLHRDPEVQPLLVLAHDGRRSAGQAARGPDPNQGDAPPRRVRHRGPLGLQGAGHGIGHRLAPAASSTPGLATRRSRIPRRPEARPRAGRGLRVHPEG